MKKGMTQIELAQGVCMPSMVSQIESNKARPSYAILSAIANRFEVSLDTLLSDVELNLEYVSTYKMSRAMIAAKEYSSAIPLHIELLETPRGQIATVDLLYDLGECYLYTGNYEEAEQVLKWVLLDGQLYVW
jgi:transcriptional regulator with XRE-family HTH domain